MHSRNELIGINKSQKEIEREVIPRMVLVTFSYQSSR